MRIQRTEFEKTLVDILQNEKRYIQENETIRHRAERGLATPEQMLRFMRQEALLKELARLPELLGTVQLDVLRTLGSAPYKEKRRKVFDLCNRHFMCRTLIYYQWQSAVALLSNILDF